MPASKHDGRGRSRALTGLLLTAFGSVGLAANLAEMTRSALQQAAAHADDEPRAPLIPRDVLLRRPAIHDVRLSPDARYLSFLKYDGQRTDVWLQAIESGERTRLLTDVAGAEQAWSGDGQRLWVADQQGLAVVDLATRQARRILKWERTRKQRFWGVDARAPDYALVSETVDRNGAAQFRYSLIDAGGQLRLLHDVAQPLRKVLLTETGSLAYAAAFEGPDYDTVIRRFTREGAREVARCRGIETCELVGYGTREQELWLLSQRGSDTLALQRWRAGDDTWQTVHRDPTGLADADALLWNAAQETWQAIAYYSDRRHWHAHGATLQARLTTLRQQLPDANLQLSMSSDGRVWLVRAQQSDGPIDRHFLYEPNRDRLQALFEADDAAVQSVSPTRLTRAQPVSWRARDGMLLHGYVYLPRGVAPAQAPLIAWLHGGPFESLRDEYDPRLQLLANRGYAVFLPNFRASSGYGLKYKRAVQGDVGNGRVLRDVIDGLDTLLDRGIGDRARQAVMGHSFGGYLSLLAVSHYPNRFRFAFAGAAPTDYGWTKQWQAENESDGLRGIGVPVALSFQHHGLPFTDAAWRDKMRRESPLAAAPSLRTPIYLWAGAHDDRVPIKSLAHYASEVRRHDHEVTLLIDPDAGHSPQSARSEEAWVYLMERAAHRHFGGGLTPASLELEAFLRLSVRIDSQRAMIEAVR